MSRSIVLSDSRLWAIGADGWSRGFGTVRYTPRLLICRGGVLNVRGELRS